MKEELGKIFFVGVKFKSMGELQAITLADESSQLKAVRTATLFCTIDMVIVLERLERLNKNLRV